MGSRGSRRVRRSRGHGAPRVQRRRCRRRSSRRRAGTGARCGRCPAGTRGGRGAAAPRGGRGGPKRGTRRRRRCAGRRGRRPDPPGRSGSTSQDAAHRQGDHPSGHAFGRERIAHRPGCCGGGVAGRGGPEDVQHRRHLCPSPSMPAAAISRLRRRRAAPARGPRCDRGGPAPTGSRPGSGRRSRSGRAARRARPPGQGGGGWPDGTTPTAP